MTGESYRYIYAGDDRIAMKEMFDMEDTYYYLKDHLGSSRAVVREDGMVVHKYKEYRAYGSLDSSLEATGLEQNYRYTGKPLDDDGGINLYYYGARYYDAKIGRFLSVDPLHGKYPSLSPYAYCANNPINYTDPNGLWREPDHNKMIEIAFSDLPPEVVQIFQQASRDVDMDQSIESSYKHAMRAPGQSIENAQAAMDDFVQSGIDAFINGSGKEAYHSLGMAFHPSMDQTSPSHAGFQEWGGIFMNPIDAMMHYINEYSASPLQIAVTALIIRQIYDRAMKKKQAAIMNTSMKGDIQQMLEGTNWSDPARAGDKYRAIGSSWIDKQMND